MFQYTGDNMKAKDCIKAKCEYLAKRVINGEFICTDTGVVTDQVCNCGIIDEMYAKKGGK